MSIIRVCEWAALLTMSTMVALAVRAGEPGEESVIAEQAVTGADSGESGHDSSDGFFPILNRSMRRLGDCDEVLNRRFLHRKRRACAAAHCLATPNCHLRNRSAWLDLNADSAAVALFHRKVPREELAFCCRGIESCTYALFHWNGPRLRNLQESLEAIYLSDSCEMFSLEFIVPSTIAMREAVIVEQGNAHDVWSNRGEAIAWWSDVGTKSRNIVLHRLNPVATSADCFWSAWNGRSPSFDTYQPTTSIFDYLMLNYANTSVNDPIPLNPIQMLRWLPDQLLFKFSFFY